MPGHRRPWTGLEALDDVTKGLPLFRTLHRVVRVCRAMRIEPHDNLLERVPVWPALDKGVQSPQLLKAVINVDRPVVGPVRD